MSHLISIYTVFKIICLQIQLFSDALRPDFTSTLVLHGLVFGTPLFYIAPYGNIKHELVNLSSVMLNRA